VSRADYENVLRSAECACGSKSATCAGVAPLSQYGANPAPRSCNAILGVTLTYEAQRSARPGLVAEGSLRFVLPDNYRMGAASRNAAFTIPPFRAQCGETDVSKARADQIAAADEFFDEMMMHHEIIQDGSVLEHEIPTANLWPPIDRDVRIDVLARRPTDPQRLQKVRLRGICQPDFERAMLQQLEYHDRLMSVNSDVVAPNLDLQAEPSDPRTCTAVILDNRNEPLFKVAVHVRRDEQWPSAGLRAGAETASYLSSNDVAGSLPSRWNALLLSGLPQLRDPLGNKTAGYWLAGTDLTLLAGAVATLASSVALHNQAADHTDGSMHKANVLLGTSTVLFSLVAIERVMAALTYSPVASEGGR